MDRLVLTVNARSVDDPPLLTAISDSRSYAGVHDDCYFYLETRQPEVPTLVLARLLAGYAGATLLADPNGEIEVPIPSSELVSELLRQGSSLTGELISATPNQVVIGLTATEWRLGDAIPEPELAIVYDPTILAWTY